MDGVAIFRVYIITVIMAAMDFPADEAGENRTPEDISTDTTDNNLKEDERQKEAVVGTSTANDEPQAQEPKKAGPPTDDDMVYPKGIKLVAIMSALYISILLVALDQTIISTAIPKITDQFRSIQDIGWYGSAYLLTSTALQPSFGRIYTIFDVRLLLNMPPSFASPHHGMYPFSFVDISGQEGCKECFISLIFVL